jgi:hypothetical protein
MALAEIPARRLLLFGKKGFTGGLDPNWWKRFQYGGVLPSVVLDFANGVYWNGSSTLTDPSSMIGGAPTITPGAGLLCNSASIAGIGALLTAVEGSAYNIQIATFGGTNGQNVIALGDGANVLFGENSGGGFYTFRNSDSSTLAIATSTDFTKCVWGSLSNASGVRRLSSTGVGAAAAAGTQSSDANNYSAP